MVLDLSLSKTTPHGVDIIKKGIKYNILNNTVVLDEDGDFLFDVNRRLAKKIGKVISDQMTNGDKIRTMDDKQLSQFFEILLNQDRDDWAPIGCYGCIYYGTHHQEDGDCDDCEWKDGILEWLKRKAEPDK